MPITPSCHTPAHKSVTIPLPWQEQGIHQDEGDPSSLSVSVCIHKSRSFRFWVGTEDVHVKLLPGDAVVFSQQVWHNGTANEEGSISCFAFVDRVPGVDGEGFSDNIMLSQEQYVEAYHHQAPGTQIEVAVHMDCRPLEVGMILHNSFVNPAFLTNIKGS
jgi:hypothetical protein